MEISILKYLSTWQYQLNMFISKTIRSINDENSLTLSLTIIGVAFLYGLIHAAGPGHGKAVVALYFGDGKKRKYKEAFKMGYLISIIHTISALVVTFGLFFIIKTFFYRNFHSTYNDILKISSIMIILVGFYIIYEAYKTKKTKENITIKKDKSKFAVALSVGIVPCPGVMTIVLFSVMLKHYILAILSAIAMSLGMGLTISIVGILSVLFSKKTNKFIHTKGVVLQMISGILIIFLGIFLLYGAWK